LCIPLLLRLLRRRRPVPVAPPIPPHEVAYRALAELEGGALLDHGRFQDYYLQLTEIAKGYLQGRFGIHALDRTTEELRQELLRTGERIVPLQADEVIRFLQACDLVKFARLRPELDEAAAALATVRQMIDRSRPASKAESSDAAEPGSSEPTGTSGVGDEEGSS
jgi:hypothetical protein